MHALWKCKHSIDTQFGVSPDKPAREIRRSEAGDTAFEDAAAVLRKRLLRMRKKLSLTQEAAAERIGIHEVTLREIECGRMNVTLATLVAIAVA